MGLIKVLLKLVFWGAAAVAAVIGVIVALQKAGVLPKDYTIGEGGPVTLRVQSGENDLPVPKDEAEEAPAPVEEKVEKAVSAAKDKIDDDLI